MQKDEPARRTAAWHGVLSATSLVKLRTYAANLSIEAIKARLFVQVANRLSQALRYSRFTGFLARLHNNNILIDVLIGATIITVSALLGHWIDTVIVVVLLFGNAVIRSLQEGKTEQIVMATHMLAPRVNVIRSGKRLEIEIKKQIRLPTGRMERA